MQDAVVPRPAGLAGWPPASFAFTMATGIVAVAAHLQGQATLALVLFMVDGLAWAALMAITAARVLHHPAQVGADFRDHARAPGFFTTVAATAVLASECALFGLDLRLVQGLGVLAAVLWLGLTYGIFAVLTVGERKPSLERGINGTWLLATVATQSVAVVAALLAARLPQPARQQLNFLALSMWLVGGMLYLWLIALVFYRYTFLRFEPADLGPAYWINMGAMAISTLAGSLLVLNVHDAPLLQALLPFLKGVTVLYWATGTWWIPLLVALAAWRYVLRRFPLRVDVGYWGAVFPLGMYSVGTWQMAHALELQFLLPLAAVFCWLALAAWLAVAVGQLRSLGCAARADS